MRSSARFPHPSNPPPTATATEFSLPALICCALAHSPDPATPRTKEASAMRRLNFCVSVEGAFPTINNIEKRRTSQIQDTVLAPSTSFPSFLFPRTLLKFVDYNLGKHIVEKICYFLQLLAREHARLVQGRVQGQPCGTASIYSAVLEGSEVGARLNQRDSHLLSISPIPLSVPPIRVFSSISLSITLSLLPLELSLLMG